MTSARGAVGGALPRPGAHALWLTLIAGAGAFPATVMAQAPTGKPIRIVVGFSPGGGTDVTARLLAQKLSATLGQQVVVENRTGAAGWIATEGVAKAPADGQTLLMVASATAASVAARGNAPFSLEKDFVPISLVTVTSLVLLAHPSVPARDVKELIAHARSAPSPLTFGSDGIGSSSHLSGELFGAMAGLRLIHVPFKGGADSAVATAAGQILLNFPSVPSALPLLKAGRFNGLAVTTAKRSTLLPDLPTLNEAGLAGYDVSTWYGLLAPAGLPADLQARLNQAVVKTVNTDELRDFIGKQGMEAQVGPPAEFGTFMRTQMSIYSRIAKLPGVKVE
jgi:tripartite-type tricarboxylate transporter receptor subunit TctC